MYDDRICKDCERTDHIRLTCKNHPTLRWMTKNIGGIGQCSIFYLTRYTAECECSPSLLYHIHEDKANV